MTHLSLFNIKYLFYFHILAFIIEIKRENRGMENLKKLRVSRGLSQQALAEKFNLTQQAIYKYENGLAEPDIEMLRNLAVFFGVSVDYLLGIKDY